MRAGDHTRRTCGEARRGAAPRQLAAAACARHLAVGAWPGSGGGSCVGSNASDGMHARSAAAAQPWGSMARNALTMQCVADGV
jgi:hypothetical protein